MCGSKSRIMTHRSDSFVLLDRACLSRGQDVVIAEPEVQIYPLSSGRDGKRVVSRFGVLHYWE